ncbi:MAG: urease accessory protein UreF [Desertifilum sp.]|nr:urease accessory protein UreF [Desertifilum sp.]
MNLDKLLYLLQLASPALPIGAYSYSEGLEILVEQGVICNESQLQEWMEQSLSYGSVRLEAAIALRAIHATIKGDRQALDYWNNWSTATKETSELRAASWQMGRSLSRLLIDIQPQIADIFQACKRDCNYSIAYGIAAAYWEIPPDAAIVAYLQSWATNLMTAGVKLIPLGQTTGQQLLLNLHPTLLRVTPEILMLADEELSSFSWGLSLASMAHETQYTRLFRS